MQLRDFQDKFLYFIPFGFIEKNDIEKFTIFLESKPTPDLNMQDDDGTTLLMFATKKGNADAVKLLLKYNVDVNLQNKNGDTALSLAAYHQRKEIVDLLLDKADIHKKNKQLETVLMTCLQKDFVDCENRRAILNSLLEAKADVNTQNENGMTPLMREVYRKYGKDNETIKLLLNAKADVNIQNKWKQTAFMAYHGYSHEIPKMLLKNAKVNMQDEDGNTALILACGNTSKGLIKALIEAGADVNVQNAKNKVAYDVAQYDETRRLLVMANPNNTCFHKLFLINKRPEKNFIEKDNHVRNDVGI